LQNVFNPFKLSHYIPPFATARKAIASLLSQINQNSTFVFPVAPTAAQAKSLQSTASTNIQSLLSCVKV